MYDWGWREANSVGNSRLKLIHYRPGAITMTVGGLPQVVDRQWTEQEFLDLPDSVGYELVDGQLVVRNTSEECSCIGARVSHLLQVKTEKTKDARFYGADLGYKCFAGFPKNFRRAD